MRGLWNLEKARSHENSIHCFLVSYFIYDSKKLSNIDSFASSNNIQVMIVNVQNFNVSSANARRIDMALDEFQSRKPIDVLAKTRPILILTNCCFRCPCR